MFLRVYSSIAGKNQNLENYFKIVLHSLLFAVQTHQMRHSLHEKFKHIHITKVETWTF